MEVESDRSEDSIIDILSSDSAYEPDEMEIESSEYELEDTESESSDLPEPTFLLTRPNFNFEPDYGTYPNLDFSNADQKKKEVHKVNKSRIYQNLSFLELADSKLKFVPAAFNILANNDFLHSFSFTPFPEKSNVRQLVRPFRMQSILLVRLTNLLVNTTCPCILRKSRDGISLQSQNRRDGCKFV